MHISRHPRFDFPHHLLMAAWEMIADSEDRPIAVMENQISLL